MLQDLPSNLALRAVNRCTALLAACFCFGLACSDGSAAAPSSSPNPGSGSFGGKLPHLTSQATGSPAPEAQLPHGNGDAGTPIAPEEPNGGETPLGGDAAVPSPGAGTGTSTGAQDTRAELPDVPSDAPASWTVLVYMNADNNLEAFSLGDLLQLVSAGSSPDVNILIQIDRAVDERAPGYTSKPFGDLGEFTSAKRIAIRQGGVEEIADLGEVNMGAPETLANFVSWGVKYGNTGHTALVLWDHGGGWDLFGPDDSSRAKPSDEPDGLTLPEVAQGIEQGLKAAGRNQKLDLVGFDACLMGTFETASILRPYAETLLASQEVEPGNGWDWTALSTLVKNPKASAETLGKALIAAYQTEVAETRDATLSLINLKALPTLSSAFSDFAMALSQVSPQTLGTVRAKTPEFAQGHDKGLIDLGEFTKEIAAKEAAMAPYAKAVTAALKAVTIANYHGPDAPYANGLSLYFPRSQSGFDKSYDKLLGVGTWQKTLQKFLETGQQLGEFAAFTNPEHLGDLNYDATSEMLIITGNLAPGAAEQVVSATTNFGIVVEQQLVLLGATDATWSGTQVQGQWDLKALVGSQGTEQSPFYYSLRYSAEAKTYSFTIPVLYTSPGGDSMQLVYELILDEASNVLSQAYFGEIAGAVGEVDIGDQGIIQPVLYVLDPKGETQELDLDVYFDAGSPLDFSFEPLKPGTHVLIDVETTDYGGNTDVV